MQRYSFNESNNILFCSEPSSSSSASKSGGTTEPGSSTQETIVIGNYVLSLFEHCMYNLYPDHTYFKGTIIHGIQIP